MLQYFPNITGSLTVSGDVIVSGSIATTQGITISGSIDSASYSSNSEKLDNLDSTAFVFTSSFNTYSSSMSTRTTTLENASASLNTASGSFSGRVTRIEGNYATTGSNVFMGAQTVCANITSTGTIIAQTLNVQQVTSSVVYSSGSNVFGCSLTNTQQFTGSVTMTGSLAVFTAGTSPEFQVVTGGTIKGNVLTDVHQVTGSLRITGSVASFSVGCTGIGTASPADRLHVSGGNLIVGGCFFSGDPDGLRIFSGHWATGNTNCYLVLQAGGGNASFGTPQGWGGTASIYTCNQTRLSIDTNGVACFRCQVCVPTIIASSCGLIGTSTQASTYNTLTIGGTGISIADDGNAKLQIGRFNSANCNAYIKMGINTCSLRFTNPGDTVDVVTFDKGGSVLIGTTATPVGKLDVATGGNTNVVISNDSTDTGYNIISLNGTRTKGSYAGIAGGGTGDDRLYLNSGVEVVIQTGASYTARMRTYATGPTCFSCPISITGAGSGIALNFGNSVANNILYINSYGGWSGIGMDATSATMRIAGDITEPNGIVQFGYYKGGTLNNACWCQKAVILTTGIGCFANTVCAPLHVGNVRGQATIKKAVGSMNGGGSSQLIYLTSNIQADYGINDYSISVFAAGNSAEQSSLRALAAYGYYASSVTTTELAKFLSSPDAHSQLSFGICKLGSSNTYCYAVFFAKSSGTISGYCVTVTFNGITAGGAGDASTY